MSTIGHIRTAYKRTLLRCKIVHCDGTMAFEKESLCRKRLSRAHRWQRRPPWSSRRTVQPASQTKPPTSQQRLAQWLHVARRDAWEMRMMMLGNSTTIILTEPSSSYLAELEKKTTRPWASSSRVWPGKIWSVLKYYPSHQRFSSFLHEKVWSSLKSLAHDYILDDDGFDLHQPDSS